MSENEEKLNDTESNLTNPDDTSSAQPDIPIAAVSEDIQPASPPQTLEDRILSLESEKAELKDRMLRIAADFENWKKRSRKEMTDNEGKAKETVLRDFLDVVDNLERATLSFADNKQGDVNAIKEGVTLVLRQFQSKFERYQVKAVSAKDMPFDPRIHEAISQVPAPGVKPGTVIQELQKGYFIAERLLRPAMVVVAAPGSSVEPAATPISTTPGEGNQGT